MVFEAFQIEFHAEVKNDFFLFRVIILNNLYLLKFFGTNKHFAAI